MEALLDLYKYYLAYAYQNPLEYYRWKVCINLSLCLII